MVSKIKYKSIKILMNVLKNNFNNIDYSFNTPLNEIEYQIECDILFNLCQFLINSTGYFLFNFIQSNIILKYRR